MATIPQSSNYDNNYSYKLRNSETIINNLTDGIATFSNGTITNLVNPINLQDAVTKEFVDNLVNVAPPVNSIQYNDLTFAGSSNLTYDGSNMTVNGIIEVGNNLTISGSTISGLSNPLISNAIANKEYVDSFSKNITNTFISSDVDVIYTTEQMVNGFILRNTTTPESYNLQLNDTTASALDIINYLDNPSVGYTFKWSIMNSNAARSDGGNYEEIRDGVIVNITPGTGVSFYPNNSFNIRRNYILDTYVVIDDIITPSITIYINRCAYSGLNLYFAPSTPVSYLSQVVDFSTDNSTQIRGNIFWNSTDNLINSNNYSYTNDDIKNKLVIREPTAISNDIFGPDINPNYLNQIMIIQNPSIYNINITGQTDIWNLVPSTITIPPSTQVKLSLTKNNPTILNGGSYYNYGTYNTSGGLGSGMTITVNKICSLGRLDAPGSGYTQQIYFETTNITNPSVTGLVIAAPVDEDTGGGFIISSFDTVYYNYLDGGYQSGDVIRINGGNNDAIFTLLYVNTIDSFTINTLGDGLYLSTDTIDILGPGTGVGAQIQLGNYINVRTIGKMSL